MPSFAPPLRLKISPSTALLLAALCAAPSLSYAQQTDPATAPVLIASSEKPLDNPLPDAPSVTLQDQQEPQSSSSNPSSSNPKQTEQGPPPGEPVQTGRILFIMPNFRSVSADEKLPPQTAKQKFLIAGKDTFDYSSFFIAGIQAGFAMNGASYPEFHQGAKGYARYYWHTLADTVDENFMVGGAGPAIFHSDNRFYTLGHGGFLKRAGYAVSRVAITRTDAGDPTFNFSEIIGAGAASGLSSTYYPTRYRTWTKVGQKWLTSMIIDGANFTLKEFWPDINQKLFHTH
ncbi:hypothetical protein [Granulicella sibirica]|uniref:Uncharacterized protein n=1 Tax=Granulicella sibirica TaxID=2479048 RepID=A0A4Q0T905_9BACT|nr:hypothetical protein [Granulicella sibirica]RXH58081.1 hypothetical protein GRAN_1391 [Granulicella sibirica]